jgi:hypothetical protein
MHPNMTALMREKAMLLAEDFRQGVMEAEANAATLRADPMPTPYQCHNGHSLGSWLEFARAWSISTERARAVFDALDEGLAPPTWTVRIGWGFVVRATTALPPPSSIEGIRVLGFAPCHYDDTQEVACGDYVISLKRGRRADKIYLSRIDPDGNQDFLDLSASSKAQIAEAIRTGTCGADRSIIKGTVQAAAVVRRILADREGFVQTQLEQWIWQERKRKIEARLAAAEHIDDDEMDALAGLHFVDL